MVVNIASLQTAIGKTTSGFQCKHRDWCSYSIVFASKLGSNKSVFTLMWHSQNVNILLCLWMHCKAQERHRRGTGLVSFSFSCVKTVHTESTENWKDRQNIQQWWWECRSTIASLLLWDPLSNGSQANSRSLWSAFEIRCSSRSTNTVSMLYSVWLLWLLVDFVWMYGLIFIAQESNCRRCSSFVSDQYLFKMLFILVAEPPGSVSQ